MLFPSFTAADTASASVLFYIKIRRILLRKQHQNVDTLVENLLLKNGMWVADYSLSLSSTVFSISGTATFLNGAGTLSLLWNLSLQTSSQSHSSTRESCLTPSFLSICEQATIMSMLSIKMSMFNKWRETIPWKSISYASLTLLGSEGVWLFFFIIAAGEKK